MGKQPAFQFYPGDWLRDPELRLCSFEAKGAWIDALCLAFACAERGVFLTNGRPWTRQQVANAIGCRTEVIDELIDNGVARIRQSDGAIYCSRMVKDEKIRLSRCESGSKGGSKTQAKRKQTVKQTSSKSEANGQAKSGSSSSSSSSSSEEETPPLPPSRGEPRDSKRSRFRPEDVALPENLDTPEFRRAWHEWCDYRRRNHKSVSLQACTKAMNKLARAGPAVAVQAIEMSIQNDWRGLFPDKVRLSTDRSSLAEISAWGEESDP